MNRKTTAKIILDAAMGVLFLLLMNTLLTGVLIHEILGVAILALFIAHLAVNSKWLGTALRKRHSATRRQKGIFILNAAVAVASSTCIVTGVMISQYLFAPIAMGDTGVWYDVHDISAWVSLSLLILHGALHWRWIAGVLRQIAENAGKIKAFAARAGTGLLAAGAVFSLLTTSPVDRLLPGTPPGTGSSLLAGSDIQTAEPSRNTQTIQPEATADAGQDQTVSETARNDVTLEEYLSKLYCSACHRHCPLSSPQCGRGERQAQIAEQEYNETITNT